MGPVAEDGGINLGDINSVNGCTSVTVRNCHVEGFYTGISVRYGNQCSLLNNEVESFTLYGVMLSRTQDFICSQNEIHGSVVTTGTNAYCISAAILTTKILRLLLISLLALLMIVICHVIKA